MQTKLSIITINFNNLEGLKKTVESVINQTWKDFEWIIIDGGSADGSKEYIINLNDNLSLSGWNPITYWCSEPDKGIYNAMNKGIAKASGEYLNFMNSGDCFYEYYTLQNVFAQEHTADIIYGDWKRIWSDHDDCKHFPFPVEIFSFYMENISHQAMFIRRDYHVKHLYDESYRIFADYKNWGLAALEGAAFEYTPNIVSVVTMDGISCQKGEARTIEYEMARNAFLTTSVRLTCERLYKYQKDPYQIRLRKLLIMGGLPKFLTRCFLKFMKILFLKDPDENGK